MTRNRLIRNYPVIFCIFLILLLPVIVSADAEKIFMENSEAVVVVITLDANGKPISQGSGFIVRSDGAVVTNYHVVSNAKDIKVKAGKKILDVEGLIHAGKENDLVILKAKGERLPVVRIGDIKNANIGEKVYVISSPEGLENTISDGLLSGIREIDEEKKILQITAPVSPGSSGGPVFNKDGEVIGIATFIIKEAQNLNFAMPVNLIKSKFENKKIASLKDSSLEDYKKTAEYWFYLGVAYSKSGTWQSAIEAFKNAIKIKPDSCCEARYNLGTAYINIGMWSDAIETLKQTIKLRPDYAEGHANLAYAYAGLGLRREAIGEYKHAIRIQPDSAYYYNLGLSYAALGMYAEAIETFKQTINIKPDFAEAYSDLGLVYALGRHREAIDAYKQAIRFKPDYAKAHFGLGLAYLAILQDKSSALEEYKILKGLDTKLANDLFNMIYY
ncbi:MAG: serine protease [Nitrospirae bacterium]|nr:serine protease [Nitrospirota bacterium]